MAFYLAKIILAFYVAPLPLSAGINPETLTCQVVENQPKRSESICFIYIHIFVGHPAYVLCVLAVATWNLELGSLRSGFGWLSADNLERLGPKKQRWGATQLQLGQKAPGPRCCLHLDSTLSRCHMVSVYHHISPMENGFHQYTVGARDLLGA